MKACIRNFLIFIAFILYPCYLFSQITTEELPPSFYEPDLISQKELVFIEAPDMEKVQAEDAINDAISEIIKRFAVAIPVSINSKTDGEWKTSPKGDLIWHLTLVVKNAQSLDLTFDKFWLPEKGKFYLYNPESKQTIGAITSEFLRGSKEHPADFSTAIIHGDSLTLEYYQPSSLKEMPVISISKIYYGYRYTYKYKAGTKGFGDSGGCQVNVNCSEGQNWQNEKRAVARIAAKFPDREGWCTGSLVNNTSNNLQPLFLTANHNLLDIFDAISNPDLSQWIFYWNYEFSGCN